MSLDDTTLIAYVDGELDSQTVQEVEAILTRSPQLSAKVEVLRETAILTRAALNPIVHESVPDRLLSVLRAKSKSAARRSMSKWQWWWQARTKTAFAAVMAVFVVGFGSGYFTGEGRVMHHTPASIVVLESADRSLRDAAFQEALEFKISGSQASWASFDTKAHGQIIPVRTFINKQGLFCREFREVTVIDRSQMTTFGVACRRPETGWNERYWLIPAINKVTRT